MQYYRVLLAHAHAHAQAVTVPDTFSSCDGIDLVTGIVDTSRVVASTWVLISLIGVANSNRIVNSMVLRQ